MGSTLSDKQSSQVRFLPAAERRLPWLGEKLSVIPCRISTVALRRAARPLKPMCEGSRPSRRANRNRDARPGREQRQRAEHYPERDGAASPRETREFPAPRYALAGGVLWVTRRVRGLVSKTGCLLSSILRSPARPNALVGLHREWFTICLSSKPSRFESGM